MSARISHDRRFGGGFCQRLRAYPRAEAGRIPARIPFDSVGQRWQNDGIRSARDARELMAH